MRVERMQFLALAFLICFGVLADVQSASAQNQAQAPAQPPAQVRAQTQGPVRITLDDAIQMALAHNHTLLAARTTIQQSEAEETTANLRPNPVLIGDAQFLPFFDFNQFSSDYLNDTAQFDLGLSYLFERGKKRQHRLAAAKDQTAVTRSQVADNERSLSFQVATLFTNAQLAESTIDLAQEDLKSFQNTVDISQDRYKAGDISEDDFLKIKLQLLQFQADAFQSQLAKVQALSDLRQLLGYESVSADYDVAGPFDYQPVNAHVEDLQAKALATRPDLRAAQQGVTLATSQYELEKANGKRDITAQINYTHVADLGTASLFGQIQLPIFDRNQGEIARASFAITQAQEQEKAASGQVLTDVQDAYENLRSNDQVIQLYRSGYLDEAQQDRDISEYAYRRGAASLLDYLDAERSYRATELAYRQALAAYLLAVEQLREAVGNEDATLKTPRHKQCAGSFAIAAGLSLTCALAGAFAGCSSNRNASQMTSYSSDASKASTPELFTIPQDQMSHVQVATIQPVTLTRTLRLTGAVAYNAFKTTPVITQVGGPVSRILVVPGQHVREGEAMLEVTSPDYSQLVGTYLKARDMFRVADKNYDRAKDLYDHHAIAERDLLQAESDRIQAQADMNSSEQGMKILGIKNPEDLEKAPVSAAIPVVAPIAGEVVERLVAPGQVMQAGQTQAFTISDISTVWVLANVYQADLAYVKIGDDVAVQTDSYPDTFHGKISYVSAALDPNTRTLQARIVVDNPGEKLKRDMYCTVTVTAGAIQKAIAVPDSSILRDDENQPFVYVVIGTNQFGRRAVEIGQSQNGRTQILKGLSAGEKVAGDGSLFLQFATSFQH